MIKFRSSALVVTVAATLLLSNVAAAQLGKLLGGGSGGNDLGNALGGMLGGGSGNADSGNQLGNALGGMLGGGNGTGSGSGGGMSNPLGMVGQALESAENTNLGPVGRHVLGRELAARMLGSYQLAAEDDPRLGYLRNVVVNLLRSSRLTKNFKDPVVILFDEPDVINAFAAPGGFVFITTGMLDFVENEDELAFVLAHEIAHIEMDHGLNAIKQNEGAKLFQSATSDMGAGGLFGELLAWGENGFSKDLEQEADLRGGQIAGNLGYDWKAGVKVIERLESITSRKHGSGYPDDRAAKLREGAGGASVSAEALAKRSERFAAALSN